MSHCLIDAIVPQHLELCQAIKLSVNEQVSFTIIQLVHNLKDIGKSLIASDPCHSVMHKYGKTFYLDKLRRVCSL